MTNLFKKAATFFNDYNQLIKVTIEYLRAHVRPYFTRAFVNQPSLLDLFERYLELPNMGKRTSKEEETEDAMDHDSAPAVSAEFSNNASGEDNSSQAPETSISNAGTRAPEGNTEKLDASIV